MIITSNFRSLLKDCLIPVLPTTFFIYELISYQSTGLYHNFHYFSFPKEKEPLRLSLNFGQLPPLFLQWTRGLINSLNATIASLTIGSSLCLTQVFVLFY